MLENIAPNIYKLVDHGGGFDQNFKNPLIDSIPTEPCVLITEYPLDDLLQQSYPHINFQFDIDFKVNLLSSLRNVRTHPLIEYQHFLCSFNGSEHVSRKLLMAILYRWQWFNQETCTKNFKFNLDVLDGHLVDYCGDRSRFYRKFFITDDSQSFFHSINSFDYSRFNHAHNIQVLAGKITKCFVHLVSESLATSYYPIVTEKFLYSVVSRGLFLTYGQPNWHAHLETIYGFRPYNKIFDYQFDTIKNPVDRLLTLTTMLSKFANLNVSDWHDLYEMEIDTVEFNLDHYHSGQYIKTLNEHKNSACR